MTTTNTGPATADGPADATLPAADAADAADPAATASTTPATTAGARISAENPAAAGNPANAENPAAGGNRTNAENRANADKAGRATNPAAHARPVARIPRPVARIARPVARIPTQSGPLQTPSVARGRWAWLKSPATIAIVTWAVGTPIAYALPHTGSFNGAGLRTWSMPVAAALIGAAVLGLVALRRLPGWVAGATAGVTSAWVVLTLSTLMRGTPFPFFGLLGDAGRMTALATRYSVTATSSDAFVPGSPGEYPPLFPWIVGRVSAVTGIEAWKLVGRAEILVTGAAVLVGYLMWRRLVPEWTALLATLALFAVLAAPPKCYEFIALMALMPWVLSTFVRGPRGRMHWLPAGLIGGLIFLSYYGWFIFGIFGLLAIVVSQWRSESDRRGYLLYLLKVIGVTVVVSSWYLVPFLYASFTVGTQSLGDLNGSGGSLDDMFPFLNFSIIGWLELSGLVGLLLLRKTVWWANALLALAVGAFAYRILTITGFVLTNHTQLSQYAARLYASVLAVSGVLVLAHAVPRLIERTHWTVPRNLIAVGLAAIIGWVGVSFSLTWTPNGGGVFSGYTERAYAEPYPDGHYLVNSDTTRTDWFPVTPIQQAVEAVYGPDVRRVSLSVDERLYSYLPWPGYLGTDRIGLFIQWDKRFAELQRLAATTDPSAFASASAATAFGPIDVFILRKKGSTWAWSAQLGYNGGSGIVEFTPEQFDAEHWVVRDDLPQDIVVAIRR